MPKIDVTRFMEQSGMRKARFGGYEPDDVRAALQALCTEYEQRLGRAEARPARPNRKTLHCSSIADPDRPEQPAFRPERCAGGQQLYILTPERKPGRPGFLPYRSATIR